MTGIAAIYTADGSRLSTLDTMLDAMRPRARDGIGKWDRDRVALGACMLHTTAESVDQPQPHSSEDGDRSIVIDGYLTNPDELRNDLIQRGASLRNRSDAELVLKAYETWGDECARRIEGEFAFVVADIGRHRILAARDHACLRPLFYHCDGERLFIASDIVAIANALKDNLTPNTDHLAEIMANSWYSRGATVWNEITSLLQAHTLTFSDGRIELREFWSPRTEVSIRYDRDEDYFEHYRGVLIDSVRRCSRTHKPLAAAVSGGLDSTSLYSIAHRLEEAGDLPAPSLQGYTLAGDPNSRSYELPYARAAADHVGRTLVEVPLFRPEIDWFTAQVETERDIPIPTNGAMTIGIEKRLVADGSVAYMNGDGGDEWLQGGIQYYRQFVSDRDWSGYWSALKNDLSSVGAKATLPQAIRQLIATLPPERLRKSMRSALRTWRRRRGSGDEYYWLKPALRRRLDELEHAYADSLPDEPIAWVKHNLLKSPFTDLANSMMQRQRGCNGMEPRHPMLTRQFIEFSSQTPEHIKRRAGLTKYVHRHAMAGILPQTVLERRSKSDFPSSEIDREFAAYARDRAESVLGDLCDLKGLSRLISPEFVAKEGDDWDWEIWGVYAVAAFLYYR
ncbi:MAG: asparagine synthetase B [Pseudomonadota bacterium]